MYSTADSIYCIIKTYPTDEVRLVNSMWPNGVDETTTTSQVTIEQRGKFQLPGSDLSPTSKPKDSINFMCPNGMDETTTSYM